MKIHWVGGNLPQIGKSWMVRGLAESIFNKYGISSIVVDTSIGSKLSRIYNPKLLELYDPSLYFTKNSLGADKIYELVRKYEILIIKLSSTSQAEFLKWLEQIGLLESDVEQHFWFIANGNRNSIKYFNEIYQFLKPFLGNPNKCKLSIVRNWYGLKWKNAQKIEDVATCNLSGIITNPQEIQYIEDNELILSEIASLRNAKAPLIFRTRLRRFLAECERDFLADEFAKFTQEEIELESPNMASFNDREEATDEEVPY